MSNSSKGVSFAASALPIWPTVPPYRAWTNVSNATLQGLGVPTDFCDAWTGFSLDLDQLVWWGVDCGGHVAGAPGVRACRLRLNQAVPAWEQFMAPGAAQDALDAIDGSSWGGRAFNLTGMNSDGSRTSDHNYNTCQWAHGRMWFPAICAGFFSNGPGPASTAAWYWDPAAIATNLGYTYLGLNTPGLTTFSGGRPIESGSDFDPVTNSVWCLYQTWNNNSDFALVQINVTSKTVRSYQLTGVYAPNYIPFAMIIHPVTRVMHLFGTGGIVYIDMTTIVPGQVVNVTAATAESGTPVRAKSSGVSLHPTANSGAGQALVIDDNGGSPVLSKCNLPTTKTGTYAWATVPTTGTPVIPAGYGSAGLGANPNQAGTWKKSAYVPGFAGGGDGILLHQGVFYGTTKFMRIPAAGA